MAGKLIISTLLSEFVLSLRIAAYKKYGTETANNPRLVYVLNFLDSIENDVIGFIDAGYMAPMHEAPNKP